MRIMPGKLRKVREYFISSISITILNQAYKICLYDVYTTEIAIKSVYQWNVAINSNLS